MNLQLIEGESRELRIKMANYKLYGVKAFYYTSWYADVKTCSTKSSSIGKNKSRYGNKIKLIDMT